MILSVAYANPRGCNIFGFKVGGMVNAKYDDRGRLMVKAPKTKVMMHIKEIGGRLAIRSMAGQTLVTFCK